MDYIQQFRDAIQAAGIEPPEHIEPDGVIHRFSSNGKRSDTAGWYRLYGDGVPAGSFGCWRLGVSETWSDKPRMLTPADATAHHQRMDDLRRQREEEKERVQQQAAEEAFDRWGKAAPIIGEHKYLRAKGVQAHGIRTNGIDLLVSMRDSSGKLHSIQTIYPNGDKRFHPGGRVTGCYYAIGKPEGVLCIAEGFATAASIHEATGLAVAAAFNVGNLKSVAVALREKHPDIDLIICADDDYQTDGNPGRTKATAAAQAVGGRLAVPDFGDNRPDGATDFNDMTAHIGPEAVKQAAVSAVPFAESQDGDAEGSTTGDDKLSLESLAAMPEFEYAKVKKEAVDFHGVNQGDLDKEVKRLRSGNDDSIATQGRAIELYEPEPWEDSVNGGRLLSTISETIQRHMSLRAVDADVSAVWAAHTYLYDVFGHTPRLCITAPDAECGKTVLMSHMIGNLVTRPQVVENMSPAPFFRLAQAYKPTFLIDEVDAFLREDSDLISALNNGWEPHGTVLRCVGDENEVRGFSTHCPVAMAGIELYKRLPAPTMSRSIIIQLERAVEDEIQEEYDKRKHGQDMKNLGRMLARWCQDHIEELRNIDPVLPPKVKNRMADKWRPLMAISQVAGDGWTSRIERAMFAQVDMSEPSKSHQLLTDMMEAMKGNDMHTATLIGELCRIEDAPWPDYNFKERDDERRRISPRQLAGLLKRYGIHPKDVRAGSVPKKGYYFAEVERASRRYVRVAPSPEKSATTLHPSNDAGSSDVSNATKCSGCSGEGLQALQSVADRIDLKSSTGAGCSAVADNTGGSGPCEGVI